MCRTSIYRNYARPVVRCEVSVIPKLAPLMARRVSSKSHSISALNRFGARLHQFQRSSCIRIHSFTASCRHYQSNQHWKNSETPRSCNRPYDGFECRSRDPPWSKTISHAPQSQSNTDWPSENLLLLCRWAPRWHTSLRSGQRSQIIADSRCHCPRHSLLLSLSHRAYANVLDAEQRGKHRCINRYTFDFTRFRMQKFQPSHYSKQSERGSKDS